MGCDLSLQRLSYKSTQKRFQKMAKLKNQNIFKSHNRHKFLTKNNWLSCNYSEGQLGLLLMGLNHETKNQKTGLYT